MDLMMKFYLYPIYLLILFIAVAIFDDKNKIRFDYLAKYNFLKYSSVFLILYSNVWNFILNFFEIPAEYNMIFIVTNAISFLFFVYEFFIKNKIIEKYILELQETAQIIKPLIDVFKIKETKTSYKELDNDKTKKVVACNHEGIDSFFIDILDKKFVLIPKYEISKYEYKYFNKLLNLSVQDLDGKSNINNFEDLKNLKIKIYKNKEIYKYHRFILMDTERKVSDEEKK